MPTNPIIKIKRGSGKPPTYSVNPSTGVQSGLTAGELGVNLNASNSGYVLYIGNTAGNAITFGAELDSNSNLGTSNVKIPTQKAVKDYITTFACPPVNSTTQAVTWNLTSAISVLPNTTANVVFNAQDPNGSTTGGITNLTYSSTTGTFTNATGSVLYLLVTYQITWSMFTTTQAYSSNAIIRSAWIQKNPLDTTNLSNNVYGFTTALLPPLQSTSANAVAGTQIGTALISLQPNETFRIQAKNHNTTAGAAGSSSISISGSGNIAGTVTTLFQNGTRVQIIKV